jgi:hypothetical protein
MRLGELLVKDGLITPEQVEAALSSQVLHGGRFGSNLVELSCISIEMLAKALGRQHHKPAALQAHYAQIDGALAAKLTPELAAQWHAVPLGRTGPNASLVAIATTDPFSDDIRFELRDIFESEIVEAIAPEMRLYYWLEQVYQIARLNRFKRIARKDAPQPTAPPPPRSPPPTAVTALTTEEEDVVDMEDDDSPLLVNLEDLEELEDTTDISQRVYVQTLSEAEPITQSGQLARIAVKRIAVPISGEVDLPLDLQDWKACVRSIRQSKGRDSIAKVVTYILQEGFDGEFSAGMLLSTREGIAIGWRGFVRGQDSVTVDALAVPLDSASMLAPPYATREPFFGYPESPSVIDERFWAFLGSDPSELAILPVVVLDEVACLLYVQSEGAISADRVGALGDISRAISAALTRLIRAASR